MSFDLADLIAKLGFTTPTGCREIMREEAASLNRITAEDVKRLFPNVEMGNSSQLVYVPLKMCHSMPKRNGRGRAFTPKTLSNSFASAKDSLVNLDHEMKKSGGKLDRMIGHIVASRFDPDGKYLADEAGASDTKVWIPSEPIPMLALAALSMRCEHVPKLIEEHLSGKRKWHTSMECGYKMDEASFYYRGEFIPAKDAEPGMRECVEKLSVKPYKNHELTLVLGGTDGRVDFWGMAMTPQPADADSKVLAFMSGDVFAEAANQTGKPFCFPLESKVFEHPEKTTQIPFVPVDTRESELANITVLGTTEAADGHTHDILSDGTVVPTNGHTHCIANWSIDRGTMPYFTGRTDLCYLSPLGASVGGYDSPRQSVAHMHMIDIALRGKPPVTDTVVLPEQSSLSTELLAELSHTITLTDGDVMDKLLAKMLAVISSGKLDSAEAASLKNEIASFNQTTMVKDTVKAEIASLVEAGELFNKVDHDKAVKDAADAATAKAKAESDAAIALEKKRAERREQIMGLGLNPEAELPALGGKKIGEYIGSFGADEVGETSFKLAFDSLKIVADAEKAKVTAASQAAATTAATEAVQAAAASKGGAAVLPGATLPVKKAPLLLVGAGGGDVLDDTANTGGAPAIPAVIKKIGRHALTKV